MDKMLYVSLTGAEHIFKGQTIAANNLANVNTVGFKADLQQAETQQIYGGTHPTRYNVLSKESGADLTSGSVIKTDRALDVAIQGDGWFVVQAADGEEAYTRAGNFQLTQTGQLVNGSGLPVLGEGGPIVIPPATKVEIGTDGSISVIAQGAGPEEVTLLDRLRVVNPEFNNLKKGDDGYFRTKDGEPALPAAGIKVASGMLEGSNVNAVSELLNIMSLSREFEMQMKLMKQAEEISTDTASIMKVG